jgi:hypothetical protein
LATLESGAGHQHQPARAQRGAQHRRSRGQGRYLHFLDDDDWLFPDALQHLWALAESSDAAWLYGSTQLVDRQQKPIIKLHHGLNGNCFAHVMAGEWIPLQASLIRAEAFFQAVALTRSFGARGH